MAGTSGCKANAGRQEQQKCDREFGAADAVGLWKARTHLGGLGGCAHLHSVLAQEGPKVTLGDFQPGQGGGKG